MERHCETSLDLTLDKKPFICYIYIMIKEQIERLVATLQAMTLQRMNAIREGKLSEAEQIRSVQEDIDSKIQELTCLAQVETAIRK